MQRFKAIFASHFFPAVGLLGLSFSLRMLVVAPTKVAAADPPPPTLDDSYRKEIVPLLKKYCLACHGPQKAEAELGFHKYKEVALMKADQRKWQGVIEMLRTGAMPPEDEPQPTEAERKKMGDWIERAVFDFDCQLKSDPGRVTLRRLNRAEYNNTVRDLLGIDFEPAADFPSDDVGNGFDNIGDVLSLPPLLMEKYLDAAETIAEKTIVDTGSIVPASTRITSKSIKTEGAAKYNAEADQYSIVSKGSITGEFTIVKEGMYFLRVAAGADQAGPAKQFAQMEVQLDGKRLKITDVTVARDSHKLYEFRQRLGKGNHKLSAAFLNDFYDEKAADPKRKDRNLFVSLLEFAGPLDAKPENLPKTHLALIPATPSERKTVAQAAEENLKPLLRRAFRRKETPTEMQRFVSLIEKQVKGGDTFEQAMQVALTAVLVSPHFLFRVEKDLKPNDAAIIHDVGEYEIASRLSYFLWSSMPDNTLFASATNGTLKEEEVLRGHVKRMLEDKRSQALVQNFAMQWLNLRLLDSANPDPATFSTFSADLKADMLQETRLFCEAMIQEDRSILDFLDADFTFLNERLAKHYGIAGVFGEEFRKVPLRDGRRAGVLTHGSILTLTSNPSRTSPVKRGKWILENILGTPPPDPPPDVPNLDAAQKANPTATLRQQLEIHRKNAVCASCHRTMDALGFGFENYDAIGRYRERDERSAIDSSGTLPSGETFKGSLELVQILKKRHTEFTRCLTEKMLTYALGRGLKIYDRCVVDKIVEKVEKDNHRFSTLVLEIVCSDSFRKRRGDGGKP